MIEVGIMGILKDIIKAVAQPSINNAKGKIGEAKVDKKLNPLLFGKVEHRQINNLIIMDNMGKTHQIDHIEIRENGIFCIETKNYIGLIYGSENQEKWTQVLYNGEKNQFYNPLKQNNSHIYHLSMVLNRKYRLNSVVVFVQNNADKVHCSNVVNLKDLKDYLKNFNDGTRYTVREMDEIYNTLLEANNPQISNKVHIMNVKKTQEEIKKKICPRCGADLVERKGQYGTFYGCSNYPKCTFKLNSN